MRKLALLICVVLVWPMAMVFAGGRTEKKQTLTMLIDRDINFAGAEAVIKAFEKKSGVKIDIEIRPGGTEGDNIIKTRLATGDMTDIFLYNTGALLNPLNPAQNILDLTDEPFAGKITDSFKTAASINKRLYAVPFGAVNVGAWFYNKRIYRELGLEVPKTWTQLLANLEKIKSDGKYVPLIGAYKDTWTSQLLVLADEYNVKTEYPSWPADYTANKAKYATTPAALRGFEKIAETRQYLNSDFLATTYDVALEMLATGKGVHWPMLTTALANVAAIYPEYINDIGVFGQPGNDPNKHGITVWEVSGIYVYKNSPNVELAKQFLEFYISQEGINIYSAVIKPEGPYSIKGITLPTDVYPGVLDIQAYFDAGKIEPALEYESPVKGPNLEQLCVEVGSGITSPRSAAEAYDADVQKQAIQLGLPGW
jgi:raffinose/stachyose/melibiose transport system substrate-binding protein